MNPSPGTLAQFHEEFSRIGVLPGVSAWDYLATCRLHHPELYRRLNPTRISVEHVARLYTGIAELDTHFESKLEKGRGDSYRQAQNTNYLIRSVGVLRLFDLAVPEREGPVSHLAVLDALGGNGTLTRIVRASRPAEQTPFIVTSDVSARMIESALAQGLPAIRQPLQDLIWFDDCTFDAVIVAYGTHHIPPEQRARAIAEAYRVLRPGGRIVLQDFEYGCPTTVWYDKILDEFTLTGHKYQYFTRQQFNDLLVENSFADVEVLDVYDPFILYADDPKEARLRLLDYVLTLFALEKLLPDDSVPNAQFWDELEQVVRETSTFDPAMLPTDTPCVSEFTVTMDGNRYRAEIPRICLVATGRRQPTEASVRKP
jgi:ubiquinone/menaquinone biosynthesis C-methylase UbiE